MNSTKKWLIITAILFNFVSIGWDIYRIVLWFMAEPQHRSSVFYLVYDFITIACCIAVIVLLSMAIWRNGKLFRSRYGYYMTALVISIIVNLLSISSVLLIISMFVSDWVWITPKKDDSKVEIDEKTVVIKNKEEEIARLRKLKDEGKISEEEFQERLMKLL